MEVSSTKRILETKTPRNPTRKSVPPRTRKRTKSGRVREGQNSRIRRPSKSVYFSIPVLFKIGGFWVRGWGRQGNHADRAGEVAAILGFPLTAQATISSTSAVIHRSPSKLWSPDKTNNRACLTCRFPRMFDMQISTASAYRPALAEHNERTDSVGRTRSEFHRRIHTILWMHAAVWSTASAARRMERVSARGHSLYLYG